MERLTTASGYHPPVFLLIGLLCLCITMQILGTTISFWDLQGSTDLVRSSLFEGFSAPSDKWTFSVYSQKYFHFTPAPVTNEILLVTSLFHPPISHT
jgi:hypothetical protein